MAAKRNSAEAKPQPAVPDEYEPVIVRVSRGFAASADEVFRAWLNPESIGRWMFGPALRDEGVLHLQVDPRVGGKFSFLVRRQGTEIDHVGTYREIAAPRQLVFTWGIAGQSVEVSLVQIDIHPLAAGCELTLTHRMHPRWAEYASRTEAGWAKMLAALANILPSLDDQNGAPAKNP